jgi:hypothetical protein
LTRIVAAVDAGIDLLPSQQQAEMMTGWHAHTLALLSVPAMPEGLRVDNKGVVEMDFRPSLLRVQHPRLTVHQTAAAGWLRQQLGVALSPSNIPVHLLLA